MSAESEWRLPPSGKPAGATELGIRLALWAARLEHAPSDDEIWEAFPTTEVRFALWVRKQTRLPRKEEIADRFGVTPSTAYRMRCGYLAAMAELSRERTP